MELVDLTLTEVSDPESPKYGQYLSRTEVAELTQNPESAEKVVDYLLKVPGMVSVSATKYHEFIVALAPISVWEKLFSTVFFKVVQAPTKSPNTSILSTKYAFRCLELSPLKELQDHIVTIFNTVQTPDFRNRRSSMKFNSEKVTKAVLEQQGGVLVGGNEQYIPQSRNLMLGLTYPYLINTVYNVYSNKGTYVVCS